MQEIMEESRPMRTMREFIESEFDYLLPAPGGSLKGKKLRTSDNADAYMAAVAAKVKRRMVRGENAVEFLTRRVNQMQVQRHFDEDFDALMIERIGEWIRELAS